MSEYLVPLTEAESEFVEKRSRFIGHIWNVKSEEEARAAIEATKKHHYDARHNCWCYIIKDSGVVRYSDDGEPQGTAGQPILNVFLREEITNVCCVVTRYFGGILLGAGGLTRAYSRGAKDALDAAGIGCMRLWTLCSLSLTYPLFEQVKLLIASLNGEIENTEYTDKIELTFALPDGSLDALNTKLIELSSGEMEAEKTGEIFRPGKLAE